MKSKSQTSNGVTGMEPARDKKKLRIKVKAIKAEQKAEAGKRKTIIGTQRTYSPEPSWNRDRARPSSKPTVPETATVVEAPVPESAAVQKARHQLYPPTDTEIKYTL
jgi:hypothetical protein